MITLLRNWFLALLAGHLSEIRPLFALLGLRVGRCKAEILSSSVGNSAQRASIHFDSCADVSQFAAIATSISHMRLLHEARHSETAIREFQSFFTHPF